MLEAQAYITIALFVANVMIAIVLALVGFIVRGATRAIEKLQLAVERLERELLKDYLPRKEFEEHATLMRQRVHDVLNTVHGVKTQVQVLASRAGVVLPSVDE